MKDHPEWVKAFQARKTADRFFKTEWKPLLPEAAYARSLPDSQPWFGPRGGKLPMMMGVAADDVPGPAYYTALLASPFADMLALEFARAAIAGEQLGRDDSPDILAISLSGHDYVNHRWSAESRLSHDHVLQLDRMLRIVLPRPRCRGGQGQLHRGAHGRPRLHAGAGSLAGAGTGLRPRQFIAGAAAHQRGPGRNGSAKGAGPSVIRRPSLLLDKKLIAGKRLDPDTVAEEARKLLLAEPGFATAYTRRELLAGSRAGAQFFEASRDAWHPDVSGEVQFTLKPYWMFASSSSVTTHGSPHPYDQQVPILMYGPKWVKPGRVEAPVQVTDIAPTLARILRVPVPSSSEGKPLPLP